MAKIMYMYVNCPLACIIRIEDIFQHTSVIMQNYNKNLRADFRVAFGSTITTIA